MQVVGDKEFDSDKLRKELESLGHQTCFPGKKRCRKVARSVCRPCAPATIARQASPHSAASVCRITGTRAPPSPSRKPAVTPVTSAP